MDNTTVRNAELGARVEKLPVVLLQAIRPPFFTVLFLVYKLLIVYPFCANK